MIEKRLGCGQVEELIEEAQDELTLIGKMIVVLNVDISLFFPLLGLMNVGKKIIFGDGVNVKFDESFVYI